MIIAGGNAPRDNLMKNYAKEKEQELAGEFMNEVNQMLTEELSKNTSEYDFALIPMDMIEDLKMETWQFENFKLIIQE